MCENISTSFLPGINPKVDHGFIRQSILCSVYKAQILENVDLPIPLFWLLDYFITLVNQNLLYIVVENHLFC